MNIVKSTVFASALVLASTLPALAGYSGSSVGNTFRDSHTVTKTNLKVNEVNVSSGSIRGWRQDTSSKNDLIVKPGAVIKAGATSTDRADYKENYSSTSRVSGNINSTEVADEWGFRVDSGINF